MPEVTLAAKKGYEMKIVYEAWKYKHTVYDPNTKAGGLFTDYEYVNTFLKIKKEAGGVVNVRRKKENKDL